MHLVQMLLPVRDNAGIRFPSSLYAQVRAELTDRFGGVTAYQRSEATGLWEDGGDIERDLVVLIETMVETLDRDWWKTYSATLCSRFRQDALLVRALACEWL